MTNTKIGDIFVVEIGERRKKFLQYIASDCSQLNSDVIRVFEKEFTSELDIDLEELVNSKIDFYAHCVTKLGIQQGYWKRIGNRMNLGYLNDILFRASDDYGDPNVKYSKSWWTWHINSERKKVMKITHDLKKAEIGVVIPPIFIVQRIKTGSYDFVYPEIDAEK